MSRRSFTRDIRRAAKLLGSALNRGMGAIKFTIIIFCVIIGVSAFIAGVALAIDVIGSESEAGIKITQISLTDTQTDEPPGFTTDTPQTEGTQAPPSVTINVRRGEEEKSITVSEGTVAEALLEAGYALGENCLVSPSLESEIYDGMVITVLETTVETHDYNVEVPYETEYRGSSSMYEGKSRVVQEGVCGITRITVQQTLRNGVIIENKTVSALEVSDPIKRIVERGTKKRPPSITVDGKEYFIKKTLYGRATAYYNKYNANPVKTSTGNIAVPGATVAVNPNIIPLGSRVYVTSLNNGKTWTYGPAYAHDCYDYHNITGTYVDLYMSSLDECNNFGNRNCVIYIITPAS